MLRIGDFSKLAHVTIKALRYYEEEGLLKPAFIDENNGYRYYETYQLENVSLISSYRQIGFSICEIKMGGFFIFKSIIVKSKVS